MEKKGKIHFLDFLYINIQPYLSLISNSTIHQYKYCKYRSIESIANEMYICIIFVCMLQNRCFFLYQKQVNIRAELSWAGNRRNTSPSFSSQTTGAAPELRDDGTRHRRGNGDATAIYSGAKLSGGTDHLPSYNVQVSGDRTNV